MSRPEIRRALEVKLDSIVPALATAWENTAFKGPAEVAYQRVNLLPAIPNHPTMDTFSQEQGLLQVTLMYPLDKGPGAAEARAKLIRDAFPRGLQLTAGGITTTVSGVPYQQPGSVDGDRWALPVRIPYFANIS